MNAGGFTAGDDLSLNDDSLVVRALSEGGLMVSF